MVEVVLVPLVVEELAVDVDVYAGVCTSVRVRVEFVNVDEDVELVTGGRTGEGAGGRTGVGACVEVDMGTDVGVGDRPSVSVGKVFKEDMADVDAVVFVEEVTEFCLFECVFFAKKSCVVFSSATEMRRFAKRQTDGLVLLPA